VEKVILVAAILMLLISGCLEWLSRNESEEAGDESPA